MKYKQEERQLHDIKQSRQMPDHDQSCDKVSQQASWKSATLINFV